MHMDASRHNGRNSSAADATGRGAPRRDWLLDPAWDNEHSGVMVETRSVREQPGPGTLQKGFNRTCVSKQSQGKPKVSMHQMFLPLSREVELTRLGLPQAGAGQD